MARTRVWEKEWRSLAETDEVLAPTKRLKSRRSSAGSFTGLNKLGPIQEDLENNSYFSNRNRQSQPRQNKGYKARSVNSRDKDFETTSSYSSMNNYEEEEFSVQELSHEDLKNLVIQLLQWISAVTKQEYMLDHDKSLSEIITQNFGNGEILIELLRYAGMLNLSWAVKTFGNRPSKANSYEDRLSWNFKVFKIICTNVAVPVEFQLCAGDCHMQVLEIASVRKLIACIALISRLCTQRGIDACDIPLITLRSLGIPMEVLTTRPIQKLQEMSSKGSFWVPNDFSDTCLLCEQAFSAFNWRHHCRKCGILCCGSCSRYRSKCQGYSTPQRVCLCCASDGEFHLVQEGNTILNMSSLGHDMSFQHHSRLNLTMM